jgi:hypothetical protein
MDTEPHTGAVQRNVSERASGYSVPLPVFMLRGRNDGTHMILNDTKAEYSKNWKKLMVLWFSHLFIGMHLAVK